mmetsp:Transcript_134035/g.373571  ORF Transcript_134035/g.373571 Transcript_134035/m.373571 type:complete len:303 (+) Transcript_134035:186-1094(+)
MVTPVFPLSTIWRSFTKQRWEGTGTARRSLRRCPLRLASCNSVCLTLWIFALFIVPRSNAPSDALSFFLPTQQKEPSQYNHMVKFECNAIAAIRRRAREYAVPLEVALLGIVAGALLRTGVSDERGKLTGRTVGPQLLTMALYAPMRDSVANEAMVGLFSDWRELNIAVARCGGFSVVGLVLHLTSLIRARQWAKFDALQNSERILVNILSLDERPRGTCGFQQTRSHEYYPEKFHQIRKRFWRPSALRPMRITLEQYEARTWWLSLDLSDDCFPPSWCRCFVLNLERTLLDLIHWPLVSVI